MLFFNKFIIFVIASGILLNMASTTQSEVSQDSDTPCEKNKENRRSIDDTLLDQYPVCFTCKKPITAANKSSCEACGQVYHIKCTKITKVHNKKNKLISACSACIVSANTTKTTPSMSLRSRTSSNSSINSTSSEKYSDLRLTPTPPVSDSTVTMTSEQFALLMTRLDKLDTLDTVKTSISSIDENLKTITGKMETLQTEVQDIRTITTSLDTRLVSTENTLKTLQDNQRTLQANYAALQETVNSANVLHDAVNPSAPGNQVQQQLKEVQVLAKQVRKLATQQQSIAHSCDIVIGGLAPDCFDDLKLAAFAVISTLHSDATTDDILSVRPLRSTRTSNNNNNNNNRSSEPAASASASTAVANDTVTPQVNNSANTDTDAGTNTAEDVTKGNNSPRTIKIPLLVTLSSSTLARAVISAKINRKKLHTTQLDSNLIVAAGIKSKIAPSLINVNEFLPREIYQLKLRVHSKAKDKQYNFVYFIRNGCIYARKKKEDTPVIISSDNDLQDFLESLPPPEQQSPKPTGKESENQQR